MPVRVNVEFAVHLIYFKNIDLLSQGKYFIKIRAHYLLQGIVSHSTASLSHTVPHTVAHQRRMLHIRQRPILQHSAVLYQIQQRRSIRLTRSPSISYANSGQKWMMTH